MEQPDVLMNGTAICISQVQTEAQQWEARGERGEDGLCGAVSSNLMEGSAGSPSTHQHLCPFLELPATVAAVSCSSQALGYRAEHTPGPRVREAKAGTVSSSGPASVSSIWVTQQRDTVTSASCLPSEPAKDLPKSHSEDTPDGF